MEIESFIYSYIVGEEDYSDKSVVLKEGTQGDWVYIILQGKARVRKNTEKGMLTVATLTKGDVFGEMALFEKVEALRTATVVRR